MKIKGIVDICFGIKNSDQIAIINDELEMLKETIIKEKVKTDKYSTEVIKMEKQKR